MDDRFKTIDQDIQVLEPFVDHRANYYAPGVYKAGMMLEASLRKAKYKVLDGKVSESILTQETVLEFKPNIEEVNLRPNVTVPTGEKLTVEDPVKKVKNRIPKTTKVEKVEEDVPTSADNS